MSRRPRGESAADNRVTIRLTDAERATANALARSSGTDVSAIVRRLLEEERERTDFVDAVSYDVRQEDTSLAKTPPFVFTLHHVPGRAAPLCVRRKVTKVNGCILYFVASRLERCSTILDRHRHDEDDFNLSGGYLDDDTGVLEGFVWLFLTVPTREQRATWALARARVLRALAAERVWIVQDGRALAVPCSRIRSERRDDRSIRVRGRCFQFSASDLAIAGDVAWADRMGPGAEGWRVFLDEPTDDAIAAELTRQREAEAERIRQTQAEEARKRPPPPAWSMPSTMSSALDLLGLTWPCSADDVRRAQRAAAATVHPDLGGDPEAMRRANDAAREVLDFLTRSEVRAA